MCGITGFTGSQNATLLRYMADAIIHRGPDADGYLVQAGVNLASRRLAIIDVAGGDQPIANEDETIFIVYNGEIYNDSELRQMLIAKGHVYRTRADTETLLHLYEEYGDTFAEYLNGIFAFAIWDSRIQKLLIGRDQFGIKPMHYTVLDNQLVFGSEIKTLLRYPNVHRALDKQALHYFLNLRYIPGSRTLFEGITRLPAGHVLAWQNGQEQLVRYWNPVYQVDRTHDEVYFVEGVRHHLEQAVKRQLVSDVPLGVYLSGGLDSSTVTAFAAKHKPDGLDTFSLGFNEPTDELDDAKLVATHFGTRHHAQLVEPEPLKMFPEVIWHAEEPKENILQGYLLARHARKHVTVALSGLGGDELFAGYQIHRYANFGQRLHGLTPHSIQKSVLSPLRNNLFKMQNRIGALQFDFYRRGAQLLLSGGDRAAYYLNLRNVWDYDRDQWCNIYGQAMLDAKLDPVEPLFSAYFADERPFMEQVLDAEFHTKMVEDFLNNEDRVSMGNSLEVRVPFLDRDLVQFAFSIPTELKYKNGEGKYIFRKAMQGILPQHTLQKPKWGFTFSSYHQFTKDLKRTAQQVLTPEKVRAQGIFNERYLQQIIHHKPDKRMFWHYFYLWNAVGVTLWHDMFIEGDGIQPELSLEAYL